ncbi:MAG TPA: PAS domain-containing sensor histidine kinase, partial [Noviherbaspirillum sp.]
MTSRSSLFPLARRRAWQWLVPMLLVLLFLATLLWLPRQAQQMEANERQEQLIADTLWVEQTIRFQLERNEDNLRLMANEIAAGYLSGQRLRERMTLITRNNRELVRIVWFGPDGKKLTASDGAIQSLQELSTPSRLTSEQAQTTRMPQYSQPAPPPGMQRPILMDYHVPLFLGQQYLGSVVATYSV